jgi:hypothetical protein
MLPDLGGGEEVFGNVTKNLEMTSSWITQVNPKSNTHSF